MPWHILTSVFDWKMMKFSYFCLLLAYHLLHNFKIYIVDYIIHKGRFFFYEYSYFSRPLHRMSFTESSTIAADPVLTREEAIAILAGRTANCRNF